MVNALGVGMVACEKEGERSSLVAGCVSKKERLFTLGEAALFCLKSLCVGG